MHRIMLAAALAASLFLGGCQGGFERFQTAVSLGTASVANPVTRERLQKVEAAATLVFVGLNGWRDACIAGAINAGCRDQIRAVQVYTRQIKPYLGQLRRFVKNNDQVNAVSAFNTLTDLIATVRSHAAAGGVQIQEPAP